MQAVTALLATTTPPLPPPPSRAVANGNRAVAVLGSRTNPPHGGFFYFNFSVARARSRAREFHYNTDPTNLSREKCEKNKKNNFPKTLDKLPQVCYTIIVKGRVPTRLKAGDRAEGFKSHRGRSEKKLEKPLDKPPKLCYNKGVKRRERGLLPKTSQEKKCKKPLDKSPKL